MTTFNATRDHEDMKRRWPNLDASANIEAWRIAKSVCDRATSDAQHDMENAFGCHGEPIAKAIEAGLKSVGELVPSHLDYRLRERLTLAFQTICDEMTDVRSELDDRLHLAINEQRQSAWQEAVSSLDGDCEYASDHGITLQTSLEEAFEAGINACASILERAYDLEDIPFTMEDL